MTLNFAHPQSGPRENVGYIALAIWNVLLAWLIFGGIVQLSLDSFSKNSVWQEHFATLISFAPFLGAGLLAAKIYGRPILTVVTASSKFRWRLAFTGVGIWLVLLIAGIVIGVVLEPGTIESSFDASVLIPAVLVGLLLIPLQVAAEEVFFRGVIAQAIGKFTRSRWLIIAVSSSLFSAPHLLNPEAQDHLAWAFVAYAAIGVAWQWAALQTGGLEISLGAHFINNFFALYIVSYQDSAISGAGIWSTPEVEMMASAIASVLTTAVWILAIKKLVKTGEATAN